MLLHLSLRLHPVSAWNSCPHPVLQLRKLFGTQNRPTPAGPHACTHRSPFLGAGGLVGGPVPSVSARPRGGDVGHHTPSPLPPSSAWVAHTSHHTPASTPIHAAFLTPLPSQKRAPSPGRKQAHAQPGSHSLKMPANSGVEREEEPSTGGSEGPGFHSSCLTRSPPLGRRARALETRKWGQMGDRGNRCPSRLCRTIEP